jgi:hypothetical protein
LKYTHKKRTELMRCLLVNGSFISFSSFVRSFLDATMVWDRNRHFL